MLNKIMILLFFLMSGLTFAQKIDSLDLKLIGPGGGEAVSSDGKHLFSYSIGEFFTTTTRNYNQVLTQGFQQSKMLRVVSVEAIENLNWKVEVYPNPVSEYLNVSFDKVANTKFDLQLFASTGQSITVPMENMGSESENKYILDFRSLASGSYVVKVWNTQSEKYVGTMSVIKSESSK